jgi:hypothetical protein
MGELASLIDGVPDGERTGLTTAFRELGADLAEPRAMADVVTVVSDFYPQLIALYEGEAAEWLQRQLAKRERASSPRVAGRRFQLRARWELDQYAHSARVALQHVFLLEPQRPYEVECRVCGYGLHGGGGEQLGQDEGCGASGTSASTTGSPSSIWMECGCSGNN